MYYYKTIIQYDGTNFAGFQWQKNIPTIQNEFNNALALLLPGKFTTMSASRTDSGVHAKNQVVKISSINPITMTNFLESFNQALPSQVECKSIELSHGLFRPSIEATSKEYRYFFTNDKVTNKRNSSFISNISNTLDIDSLKYCLSALIGVHDFQNFYSSGSNIKSTIRHILVCELSLIKPYQILPENKLFKIFDEQTTCYQLKIEANGFLKQMIRHIVSALWMVGSGKLSKADFIQLLNGQKSEKQLWKVAPPNGLFLYNINY